MNKIISILIPTYNEEKNIPIVYSKLTDLFGKKLMNYSYEIIFIDNSSSDSSWAEIQKICNSDKNVKGILNSHNYGFVRSTYYGLLQTSGDCTVLYFADMQDPIGVILNFVLEWESGKKLVLGIKNKSKESKPMYAIRSLYYNLISKISEIGHIKHFTGFGLYDKSFIDILREIKDPYPYLRGLVAEYGYCTSSVYYEQDKRQYGKSSFNFFKLYDLAMLGITSYSKTLMRFITFFGFFLGLMSFVMATITFILKLFSIITYPVGNAAIILGVFFFSAVQLFFMGIIGEYIASINLKVVNKPLVIEEKRINFDK